MADDGERPIIKKVIKKVEGGAHGGAWKVAYADFVTAMMAFFMLLWLLNVAPPETLSGLADYFKPTSAVIQGGTPGETEGGVIVRIADENTSSAGQDNDDQQGSGTEETDDAEAILEKIKEQEDIAFAQLQEKIRMAIQESAMLQELNDQVIMEITEDGMKIQLIDKDKRAMFRSGSDELYNYARAMIEQVAMTVQDVPNRITIQGHTDGGSFSAGGEYTNWELSADRANSARRVLAVTGVTDDRFSEVIGKASTEPLYPDNPSRLENRRITILVLREAPVVPPNLTLTD
ncbi:chemotaxis protein MotB [Kordiimonas sediminis]|uniref:Chemotaxis protein MotB n=1 Tax=Kordiimonas sediminis TaxID=1735581 RepID=A0A919AW41_9PROT|nr:flagellar motor protein MotB [Kordiimonas sediminis]GHF26340.1 chemotaxis protein MotB [Kordiimonas sediminis]